MQDTEKSAHRLFDTTASQAFLDSTPVALVITDPHLPDEPIVYVNANFSRLTGYEASAAVGRNCRFLQGPDTDPATVQRIRDGLAARESFTVTLRNYRADGSAFWNELTLAPLEDLNGNLAYFLGIQAPATRHERTDHELQLRELQHRVKNHLQLIVSIIRMQARNAPEGAETQYTHLARRIQVLEALYRQLSDVPAEGDGKEEVDLASYISQITGAIAHLLPTRGVTVEQEAEPMRAKVELALPLGLMVSELVTNAVQHAFPGGATGRVSVSLTRVDGTMARLVVDDDGIGLPEGVGWPEGGQLGGRIVGGLIEQANATLTIERPNRGTRFVVDFGNVLHED